MNQQIRELQEQILQLTNENKQLKEELEQRKADSINKAQFYACASHDLRTPLNAIVGFAQLMCEDISNEERTEYMEIVKMNGLTLSNLINDILDLSKIDAGHMQLAETDFNVGELFIDIYESFEVQVKEGQRLILDNQQQDCPITFDRQRFTQVLNNYLSNAIKFTPEGEIHFGYKDEGKTLYVYVTDSGIGISEENLKRIFQQFQRFNKEIQGTGLGLSICKAIIETCKGQVGCQSQLGKGSTFWFRIPKQPA